jgi:hypothetical protein
MLGKVLIPLDGSANAEKIAGWSEGLAEAFDSDLVLLMVVDPDKIDRSGEGAGRDRPARDSRPYDAPGGAGESTVGVAFGGVIADSPSAPSTEEKVGYGTHSFEQATKLILIGSEFARPNCCLE